MTAINCTRRDKEFNAMPYASVLEKLDWGDSAALVIGHKYPDTDAVCSAIAYAWLMNALGHPCRAGIAGPLSNETRMICEKWSIPIPDTVQRVDKDTRLIMVDHSDYSQSVEGAASARLLQIIDHHGTGGINERNPVYCRMMPVGSTCTAVYLSFLEFGVDIPCNMAYTMLAGLISDTKNLSKKTTTPLDTAVCAALTARLGLSEDEIALVCDEMAAAARDFSGMSDKEIFLADYRDYSISGIRFGVGSLGSSGSAATEWFLDRMLAVMPEVLEENGSDMLFAKFDEKGCGTWILYCGDGAKETAERAFGASVRDGLCFSSKNLNRKMHVVPMIDEALRQRQETVLQ